MKYEILYGMTINRIFGPMSVLEKSFYDKSFRKRVLHIFHRCFEKTSKENFNYQYENCRIPSTRGSKYINLWRLQLTLLPCCIKFKV